MSLAQRVLRHSRISSIVSQVAPQVAPRVVARLAVLAIAGLAACGGHYHEQKVASSGHAPSTAYGPSQAYEPGRGAIAERVEAAPDRPGLGTSWGEPVTAPVSFAPFERASAAPWAEVALHYNDAEGVMAHARYLGTRPAPLELRTGGGALSVALVDESGRLLPGVSAGGRTLIVGEDGRRYRILVHNATGARFEVVASVDGLDVIDGQPADPNRRGYLIDPYGTLSIDGFRTSDEAVAAFRFGRVADSYAAQTTGDRNAGVVGIAIFSERGAAWTPAELGRRDTANPFPDRGYAMPPR